MTNREIAAHLQEMFGAEVSPTLISAITDTVADEVRAWQSRPLDALYPIIYLDCLMVKSRDHGSVGNRAIYLAIGINTEGMKEVLGLWSAPTEGAKFWLSVVTELKNRGVKDILIACVDGLKGFPEAIETVFPHTEVQLCLVHLVRNSLNLRELEAAQSRGRRSTCHLHRHHGNRGRRGAGGVRGPMGQPLSANRQILARELGTDHSVLCLRPGYPQGHLRPEGSPLGGYDQRHRERELQSAQTDQEPRLVSNRRGRHQTDLSGLTQHRQALDDAHSKLETGAQSAYDSIRGTF